MPRIKMTKSNIDALPIGKSDVVYWDVSRPGFGVKVTPKGRKVFVVLYRTGGAGSRLCKYTIGPYGRVTLHQAQVAAQKIFTAKLEGRDPAAERRAAKRRIVADRVDDLLEAYIAQHFSILLRPEGLYGTRPAEGGNAYSTGEAIEAAVASFLDLHARKKNRPPTIWAAERVFPSLCAASMARPIADLATVTRNIMAMAQSP
jgi:hypothetical protein